MIKTLLKMRMYKNSYFESMNIILPSSVTRHLKMISSYIKGKIIIPE